MSMMVILASTTQPPSGSSQKSCVSSDVVFVFDFPDELFEDIFDGDDPFGAAIFIDDDRHVDLLVAEFLEELGDFFIFGGVEDRFGDGFEGGLEVLVGVGIAFEEVFVEDDAEDLIEVSR